MFTIRIVDLEVFYRVGVPEAERQQPQRLMISVELQTDAARAAAADDLACTIDYFSVSRDVLRFGDGRTWKLIEKLAADLADWLADKYRPQAIVVEVKKFVIPEARHVSVTCSRHPGNGPVPRTG